MKGIQVYDGGGVEVLPDRVVVEGAVTSEAPKPGQGINHWRTEIVMNNERYCAIPKYRELRRYRGRELTVEVSGLKGRFSRIHLEQVTRDGRCVYLYYRVVGQ